MHPIYWIALSLSLFLAMTAIFLVVVLASVVGQLKLELRQKSAKWENITQIVLSPEEGLTADKAASIIREGLQQLHRKTGYEPN